MLKEKRLVKKILAILMIVTILLPYSSEVFAVALTQDATTANFETTTNHEGGEDESGFVPTELADNYDYTPYSYRIANSGSEGKTQVFKLRVKDDNDFENEIYCLNAEKAFPSDNSTDYTYTNIGDLKDTTSVAGTSLVNSIGASNYASLVWLVDNMYLRKQQPTEKEEFIKTVFADKIAENVIPPVTAEYIASVLTDGDIEVVQQWAIWYFTNGNNNGYNADYATKYFNEKYSNFGTVYVSGYTTDGYVTFSDISSSVGTARQEFANLLYNYLVTNAKNHVSDTVATYPSFAMENSDLSCTVDGDYYKVGPFKVNGGTASATIKLVDANGTEISESSYKILKEGETNFTDQKVSEIFDTNYYIYVPIEGNTITRVKLTIDYTSYETQASLWTPENTTMQPVALITRGTNTHSDSREKDIEIKIFDLALRKYIVKNGDTTITNRAPNVDTSTIATDGTATYKHNKNALVVTPGTNVVYEIRVYNEGTLDGTATEITDYLPAGLTLAEGSSINETYGWNPSEDGRSATTTFLSTHNIEAYSGTGDFVAENTDYVQIECKVDENIASGLSADKVLTNVAEITGYSMVDKDSSKTIDPTTITDSFSGNTNNKSNLSDPTYYYRGLQDDDDFEKVLIEVKSFDLALKKFITKINGTAVADSREPVVDVTNLKNGTSNDATYTMPKTALEVKKGDIVTYKIRVYNEGEIAGYAEEISDYLPAGLGYLMNYTANVSNKWSIPEGASTIKLSDVENGTSNLKASDFTGNTALADQIVVVGGNKLTSTALASSSTSTANLIPAFDGTTLSYKDVEVTCIVLSDDASNNNLRNIAEVAKNTDVNRLEVTDRDSKPGTVNPANYPDGEKESNNGNSQDDHDYETLKTPEAKYFDLALQKFITKLNNENISNRVPTVTKNTDGKFRYSHSSEALAVANNDEVTYTIRVYNEGNIDGYAKEVMDDIPTGLVFLPENATNKAYEWKMYDKDGKETTDVNQAVTVKTTYLSKDKETDSRQNKLAAYNPETMQTPAYKDVQIVFKVVEGSLTDKTKRDIINTAEITANQDENGNNIDDVDSTPGNKKDGEDDIDREKINVKYFDLSLKKTLAKIIITENGKTREIVPANENDLLKVEINRKYLSSTTVKFVYNITITNEGQIAGYAKEVKDYIPKGLIFNSKDNSNWTSVSNDCIRTEALANTLIEPGKSATVQVTLEWDKDENNLGEKVNVAEISKDYNDKGSPDIDSTPDNKKDGEDDIDNAPVILSIATGEEQVYVVLSTTVMLILATGIALIKKYVLI